MKKITLLAIFVLNHILLLAQTPKYTISGFIKDKASGELMIGASIAIPKLAAGTVTNNYGFYSITLPTDSLELIISYVGYKNKAYKLWLNRDIVLDIFLDENSELQELVVKADKSFYGLTESTRMSVIEIPIQQVKDIPALLGEKDVLKVIQLLPGVQKGSEGNSGIYVRGGGPDQNLIILDDAIVYNAFHLFGFFSLFNGDALKNIELTKGGFPARYGGRLSSVIDMSMKEGNKNEFKGEAGIGLISSRLLLEGPLVKGKSSFLVSGRRTYVDVLARPLMPSENYGGYYFYDLNAKVNYEFSSKDKLYLSGYFGRDKFYAVNKSQGSYADELGLYWGNATATLRWNHLYNNKLFSNTSVVYSNFNFGIYQDAKFQGNTYYLRYSSGITDYSIKTDYDYRPNKNHAVKFGAQLINHNFKPSALVFVDDLAGQNEKNVVSIPSYESGIYVEDDIIVGSKLKLNPGIRVAHFYAASKNYFFFEPRLNTKYMLKNDLALKASYAVMNQFVHLLSNTGVGLPTDLWVPSSNNLKPQNSWQIAAGLSKDFYEKNFSASIEGYYKESKNIITYKEGASFLDIDENFTGTSNFNWERNITSGRGWSYGLEFLVQRKIGKLTGWIGYTLSWTQLQFNDVNFGRKFWAKYDRRHDISVVGIYEIRKQNDRHNGLTLSATWVYGTGNAITLPVSEYVAPVHNPGGGLDVSNGFFGNYVSQYTDKNQFRMAPYHRMDIGLQVTRKMKWWVRTWEFSFYNLYNRANPYFYYIGFADEFNPTGKRTLKQVSLFPIIPAVSWNIKF